MQIVEQKLEQPVSEKLKKLPVSAEIAMFVDGSEANYVRRQISDLHNTTEMHFKTRKGVQDGRDGIYIWRIR